MDDWFFEMPTEDPTQDKEWQYYDWVHFVIEEEDGKMKSFAIVSWNKMLLSDRKYKDFFERVGQARCFFQKKDRNKIFMEVYFFDERKPRFRFWFHQKQFEKNTGEMGIAVFAQDQWLVRGSKETLDASFHRDVEGKVKLIFMFKNRNDLEDIRCAMAIQE